MPVMSSEGGLFDIIYLGVFVILSPAFDSRFYASTKPPKGLVEEVAHAIRHFHFLLHTFSQQFIILLEGEPVCHSYVVDRMLGEFAATSVVFSKAIHESQDQGDSNVGFTSSTFTSHIEGILHESYPNILPYYSRCLDCCHKHFLWTGPKVQILPRSEDFISIIPLMTKGELLDLPAHRIYTIDLDPTFSTSVAQVEKRHGQRDSFDLTDTQPKKRKL